LSSRASARRCRRAARSALSSLSRRQATLYSPVSGEILGVNEALTGKPELVNEDAEGAGWIYKIKLAQPSELDTLLDREAYLAYVRAQG
jgi:glycine cleavage system H protein